jgi:hexulose-6-phosphate isomerase
MLVKKGSLSYGIMQSRLTETKGRGIQFFPFENWKNEFKIARELGLDEIQWIFDYEDLKKNPLYTKRGQKEIIHIIEKTNVMVHSVCFDYFMRRPFYKYDEDNRTNLVSENSVIIEAVFEGMAQIGATLLEVPLVDNSSIVNNEEEKEVRSFLLSTIKLARNYNITIGLESDYPPNKFRNFLDSIPGIKANYDTGNSSGLGYNAEAEILSLGEYIHNLHIKDRALHGTTVQLGSGSAEFDKVFLSLKRIGYKNSIILQAARGKEGKEKETVKEQLLFVENYVQKYGLE